MVWVGEGKTRRARTRLGAGCPLPQKLQPRRRVCAGPPARRLPLSCPAGVSQQHLAASADEAACLLLLQGPARFAREAATFDAPRAGARRASRSGEGVPALPFLSWAGKAGSGKAGHLAQERPEGKAAARAALALHSRGGSPSPLGVIFKFSSARWLARPPPPPPPPHPPERPFSATSSLG